MILSGRRAEDMSVRSRRHVDSIKCCTRVNLCKMRALPPSYSEYGRINNTMSAIQDRQAANGA